MLFLFGELFGLELGESLFARLTSLLLLFDRHSCFLGSGSSLAGKLLGLLLDLDNMFLFLLLLFDLLFLFLSFLFYLLLFFRCLFKSISYFFLLSSSL